ncbi:MAG: CocE/NonD family hydrolase [bacterium]
MNDKDCVMVPMRDGIELCTIIYKPGDGTYPVVLTRGYSPGNPQDARRFMDAGYVYIGQSTRGHCASEGVMNRFFDDPQDGYDTLTWISQQPWSNGKIAMYGKSYWAVTQWLLAPEQHPNLKAIIPQNAPPEAWPQGYRSNGALSLAMAADGRAYNKYEDREKVVNFGWEKFYRHLPLIELDTVVTGKENKMWNEYVSHYTYDQYWKALGLSDKYHKIEVPVYQMGGWYDYYPGAAFKGYQKLKEIGATSEIRIVVDPTDHLGCVVGDRDFGQVAKIDKVDLATRWLDYVVKGNDNGVGNEPPIKIFVMGINEWRGEHEWPLTRTKFTKYYFCNPDGARIGLLGTEPPGDESPTSYTYDPDNPVLTLGGNHSFLGTDHPDLISVGSVDQRPNEERDDVLVFSTLPLDEDTEVTGPIEIKLFAASSARDTDFTAKLIDVYPDGTAYNLTEGIIRARFRESLWEEPTLLVPGEIYEITLELLPTSNVFKKGHQIRVHLTSSNFPLWDRNLNTGNNPATDVEMLKAEQTVYHDRRYPSHIILPIIPAS